MNAQTKTAETVGRQAGFDIPDPQSLPSLKSEVSSEEWRLRCDLAATYRLVALYGWDA